MRTLVAHGSAVHPSQVLPMALLVRVTSKHGFKLKETPEVQFALKKLMLSTVWMNGIICA